MRVDERFHIKIGELQALTHSLLADPDLPRYGPGGQIDDGLRDIRDKLVALHALLPLLRHQVKNERRKGR